MVDPPNGKIPWLPNAKHGNGGSYGGFVPASVLDLHSWDRCLSRGLPGVMAPSAYNNGFQILQTPDSVVILYEMVHDARIIHMDGSPHISDNIVQWMGDSRGHWDGNTLVVETTNFDPRTNFRGSRDTLHLIERYTRTAPNAIDYRFTVDDPKTFTRPFTVVRPMRRETGAILVFEYACHEGNYAMANILKGARAKE